MRACPYPGKYKRTLCNLANPPCVPASLEPQVAGLVLQVEHKDFHRHAYYAMRNFDRFRYPAQNYHASVLAPPLVRASIAIGPLPPGEHLL